MKIHLIEHFNNEFAKRDEEIKRLQNELDKNEIHLSQVSSNNDNYLVLLEEIEHITLKVDQDLAQKNRIILSIQNSLSKIKKEPPPEFIK